jgi:transmembrane sensor
MDQEEFLKILNKYRSGKASEEEIRIVDEWYESLGQTQQESLTDEKEEELKAGYWSAITEHISDSQNRTSESPSNTGLRLEYWKYTMGVAASIIIALVGWFYFSHNSHEAETEGLAKNEKKIDSDLRRIFNAKNTTQLFVLSDGSKISLDPESWIEIPTDFNITSRNIKLEGKAFFDVTHNATKPFVVEANGITTKVLGTSFTIKAFAADKDVMVAVSTGKVAVYKGQGNVSQKTAIVVTPNHKIVYDKEKKTVSEGIVDVPQPLIETSKLKHQRFEEAPIGEILNAIEEMYGVEIVFNEAKLSSCKLTTSIGNGGLYDRLEIVTSAIGATYSLNENKIVINGDGCK